eukprot:CAMPEP_0172610476 /NCGR_PEP_ID=MMETSP1068-20121228/30285_1 /TAXON_ID=35684 /ORGANISM="Pseudopedinella elastica, Strain CCMP716" /LENGTH=44 /DNA_ID= /DNA_START= /DNA_END= /DNA_ORIENTATION=
MITRRRCKQAYFRTQHHHGRGNLLGAELAPADHRYRPKGGGLEH